jgi:hypothetical protein
MLVVSLDREKNIEILAELAEALKWDPSLTLLTACDLALTKISENLKGVDVKGADLQLTAAEDVYDQVKHLLGNITVPPMSLVIALSNLLAEIIMDLAEGRKTLG